MLAICYAEFSYNRLWTALFTVLLFATSWALLYTGFGDGLIAVMMFPFFLVYIMLFYILRERRERFFAGMPVPPVQVGLARVSVILLPYVLSMIILFGIGFFLGDMTANAFLTLTLFFGAYVVGFLVSMIVRDLFLHALRKERIKKQAVSIGLLVLVLGQLMLFMETYNAKGSSDIPAFIRVIDYVFSRAVTTEGAIVIYILVILLSAVSVLTYSWKKLFI